MRNACCEFRLKVVITNNDFFLSVFLICTYLNKLLHLSLIFLAKYNEMSGDFSTILYIASFNLFCGEL